MIIRNNVDTLMRLFFRPLNSIVKRGHLYFQIFVQSLAHQMKRQSKINSMSHHDDDKQE